MPLTTVTALEWKPVLAWVQNTYKNDIFERGILYNDVLESEIDELYTQGANFFGSESIFLTALYEQKELSQIQQDRIDVKVKEQIARYPRIATADFPQTSLTDATYGDALRAIHLVSGPGFEDILNGKEPNVAEKFNTKIEIFTPAVLTTIKEYKIVNLSDPSTPAGSIALSAMSANQVAIDQALTQLLGLQQLKVTADKDLEVKLTSMPKSRLT